MTHIVVLSKHVQNSIDVVDVMNSHASFLFTLPKKDTQNSYYFSSVLAVDSSDQSNWISHNCIWSASEAFLIKGFSLASLLYTIELTIVELIKWLQHWQWDYTNFSSNYQSFFNTRSIKINSETKFKKFLDRKN